MEPSSGGELEVYRNADPRTQRLIEGELERRYALQRSEVQLQWAGLISGFVVTLAFLGVSAWLINGDHAVAGTILGTIDLVALVTVFVIGRRSTGGGY